MKISEVAASANVNVQTIRYYERRGLLPAPPRTVSGHRVYDRDAVRITRFIKSAQELGFTLDEIEDLLSLRTRAGIDREKIREMATDRLEDIEQRIARLDTLRTTLRGLLEQCLCAENHLECPILDTLEPSGQ